MFHYLKGMFINEKKLYRLVKSLPFEDNNTEKDELINDQNMLIV